jgi:uncharacterized integral membrane protein
MLVLILIVVFGVAFSFFATLNTSPISLNFGHYTLADLPIYIVVLGSLALGLLISGFIYLIRTLSSSLTISEKDTELKTLKKEFNEITKEAHKLEIENTKLKTKLDEEDFDDESI